MQSTMTRRRLFGLIPLPMLSAVALPATGQPTPILTRTVPFRASGGFVTAIMRHWRPGDTARCQLCAKCSAYDDGCLFVVKGLVPKADAPLFSVIGRTVSAYDKTTGALIETLQG